jgi:hypothetical protein
MLPWLYVSDEYHDLEALLIRMFMREIVPKDRAPAPIPLCFRWFHPSSLRDSDHRGPSHHILLPTTVVLNSECLSTSRHTAYLNSGILVYMKAI